MTHWRPLSRLFLCLVLLVLPLQLLSQNAVTTHHNDLNRTGVNPGETTLNPSNVNVGTFGKLFSLDVDGMIYAQPLYVPNLSIAGGTHNVVFVATQHNSLYAFDADAPGPPLWVASLGPSMPTSVAAQNGRSDVFAEVGILSTPVIDLSSNTIYAVAENYEDSVAKFRLHALDIASGAEKFGGPVLIQGSVPGTASDSVGGVVTFNALMHFQRPGLLLWNNHIYIAFGSHADDLPYHGWLFEHDAVTLQQTAILNITPDGLGGGLWQGGVAPAVDANGNVYLMTGNSYSVTQGVDFGMSLIKLSTPNNLAVLDYFTPLTRDQLNAVDDDFGSSGPILIPGTSLAVGAGKDGQVFVFDRNNLGQYSPIANNVVQSWQATTTPLFAGHIFHDSKLYIWARSDTLKAFAFDGSMFNTTPVSVGTVTVPEGYSNEPAMSVSANGSANGILWAAYSSVGGSDGDSYQGVLRAFDASTLIRTLEQ